MTSPAADAWMLTPQIPAIYVKALLSIAQSRGLDPTALMTQAGLTESNLVDPSASVLALAQLSVAMQLIQLSGNHGLGFEVGLSLPLTTHGSLGYALLCSGSLQEAVTLLERFWLLRERAAKLQVFNQGPWCVIELSIDQALPAEIKQALFECLLTVFFRGSQLLLGEHQMLGEFSLVGPQPDYFMRFKGHLPRVCYDMPSYQFKIPLEVMNRPFVMSNTDALNHAVAQCEREYVLLGDAGNDFTARVREGLVLRDGGYPSQEHLADMLNMSLRTFRRKLQACGTGYMTLLASVRRRDALKLLETTTLSIQKIAEQLGYLNSSNFTRAFRQWTAMTPSEYRGRQRLNCLWCPRPESNRYDR